MTMLHGSARILWREQAAIHRSKSGRKPFRAIFHRSQALRQSSALRSRTRYRKLAAAKGIGWMWAMRQARRACLLVPEQLRCFRAQRIAVEQTIRKRCFSMWRLIAGMGGPRLCLQEFTQLGLEILGPRRGSHYCAARQYHRLSRLASSGLSTEHRRKRGLSVHRKQWLRGALPEVGARSSLGGEWPGAYREKMPEFGIGRWSDWCQPWA